MSSLRRVVPAVVLALFFVGSVALAQSVISAQSGLIHYIEGQAYIDGKEVEAKAAIFPQVKEKSELRTGDGRAEVLLNPGVFLRLGENSAVRMISTRLIDTRLEHLQGSILVECAEIAKDNAVTLVYKDATIALNKKGLYRLDSEPAQLLVYHGEALVTSPEQRLILKDGKQMSFGGVWVADKFDNKTGDALYRWSYRRAGYLSMANLSAAKSVLDSGRGWSSSGWYWNPWLAMFTYIPFRGAYYSPFGYSFYSPRQVYAVYAPPRMAPARGSYGSGWSQRDLGYSTAVHTASGTSGVIASAPHSAPAASSPPPSSSVSRGDSGHAGGRGR